MPTTLNDYRLTYPHRSAHRLCRHTAMQKHVHTRYLSHARDNNKNVKMRNKDYISSAGQLTAPYRDLSTIYTPATSCTPSRPSRTSAAAAQVRQAQSYRQIMEGHTEGDLVKHLLTHRSSLPLRQMQDTPWSAPELHKTESRSRCAPRRGCCRSRGSR